MNFIKTEYSFKEVFYPIEEAVTDSISVGHTDICIIDSNPFGFIKFEKICREKKVNPIYGLSTIITDKSVKSRSKYETCDDSEEAILIAKSQQGIKDLYEVYSKSTERFNRFSRILPQDLIGKDLIVICNKFPSTIKRSDICVYWAKYPGGESKSAYQCITGSRGISSYPKLPLHDLKLERFFTKDQIDNKNSIPNLINKACLPKANMIKYNGKLNFELECWKGLDELGFVDNKEYEDRLEYEIEMIKSKNFQDYFMIVSDMIKTSKRSMIVGPGRGSSGGSLVCYALGITNIDPIKFGLIFERFIDVNRSDYPDIDTDYPDTRRADVIAQTKMKYKSVNKLATIAKYSPKTILNDFAKEYDIPAYELTEVKNSIIERSSGDARAKACLADTLKGEAGARFIEKYPHMEDIHYAEGHARHSGTHAAGIIVLDESVTNYCAINHRDDIICIEGPDAESIGLLKIDCLGLRTLSIIENCLNLSGVPLDEIYNINLEDPDILNIFNGDDLSDIFQFDGDAIGMVCKRLTVDKFSDITAITALGRPGALNSGGTDKYIKINEGEKEPVYYGDVYEKVTKETNSIVVYQEQTMVLLREFGNLSWEDVNIMRKIISKSRGDEFFSKYKEKFIAGAMENGYGDPEIVWDAIASMGSYAFNKSHAVAYAMISYWCAYCKHNFPLNFLAANLNNAKDEDHALKLLRKYVKNHDVEYVTVDPDESDVNWTIKDGILLGGLTNIKGIAEKKALDIIKRRESGKPYTPSIMKMLLNPVTNFDILYPIETTYAHIYKQYNITKIEDISAGREVTTLGKLTIKDLRDRNDVQSVIKRGGEIVTENTHYLNLVIEDDTGVIKGTIAPFDMDRMNGMILAEKLAINDVIAIVGKVREGWSTISIQGVKKVEDI